MNLSPSPSAKKKEASTSSSRVINVPKGIGINEQNIYQIICKTSDHLKDGSQYLAEFYRSKLDEKTKEVSQLRSRLRVHKPRSSPARKARSLSFGPSLNCSHRRSKSQRNRSGAGSAVGKLCGESQHGRLLQDLIFPQTDPRKIASLKNKMGLISGIISRRTGASSSSGRRSARSGERSQRKYAAISTAKHKGFAFPPSTTFTHLIDATIETAIGQSRARRKGETKI